MQFLGRMVSANGISVTPEKADVIRSWPMPTSKKELESFLGYVNYHRTHIQGFAGITEPLYALTKKNTTFEWGEIYEQAFVNLKNLLSTAPCLAFPLPEGTSILDCDASYNSIVAKLSQS